MRTYFTKNRILFWLLVFLVVLNTAAISIIFYRGATFRELRRNPPVSPRFNRHVPHGGRYMQETLRLTDDQFAKFRIHRQNFQQEALGIGSNLYALKNELMDELTDDRPDEKRIREIADEIGRNHAELKMATGRYYLGIKALCNKQQQARLNEFFSGVLGHEKPPGFHGRHFQRRLHGPARDRETDSVTNIY